MTKCKQHPLGKPPEQGLGHGMRGWNQGHSYKGRTKIEKEITHFQRSDNREQKRGEGNF